MWRNIFRLLALRAALAAMSLTFFTVFGAVPAQALTITTNPKEIAIDLAYHGQKLTISGVCSAGDDLLIKIANEPVDTHLKYIGKAANIVWMKMGDMEFEHVPGVYLLYSTAPPEQLLNAEERKALQVGYVALAKEATIVSSSGPIDTDQWFGEFIKLQEKNRLYSVQQKGITIKKGPTDANFELVADWPYQAPPGTYTVEVMAVRNGTVKDRETTSFTVARTGAVAQLSGMALDHAAGYGIMAIVIALGAGFAVGALFKKGGGGAH